MAVDPASTSQRRSPEKWATTCKAPPTAPRLPIQQDLRWNDEEVYTWEPEVLAAMVITIAKAMVMHRAAGEELARKLALVQQALAKFPGFAAAIGPKEEYLAPMPEDMVMAGTPLAQPQVRLPLPRAAYRQKEGRKKKPREPSI